MPFSDGSVNIRLGELDWREFLRPFSDGRLIPLELPLDDGSSVLVGVGELLEGFATLRLVDDA